jgi:biopolymer transport protein TolR
MSMLLGDRKSLMAEMNVVPLIDVLLVLLILFFMVIVPTMPNGLKTVIPQPALPSVHPLGPENVVVVQVLSGGGLKINQDDATWDDLGPRLRAIFKEHAEKVAFVRGDDGVPFAQVARAIGVMRGSDVEQVGLLTERVRASR